ncbi:MAG: dTDP-glucose 4,6-dehydratase [Bacillota bacterium]
MDRYLITGAAGFIGSHFVKNLINKKENPFVVILDKLTYAGDFNRIRNFVDEKNIIFVKEDIVNKNLVKEIINKYNINKIINFAAESHVDKSIESSKDFIYTNILGVQMLLEASLDIWKNESFKDKLFVQISTDEVYGEKSKESIDYSVESDLLNPTNTYASTKACGEHLIKSFHKAHKFPYLIIRSTNNYGKYQNKEKFIPKSISNLLNDKPIEIYGKGIQQRCWLYVKDNVNAILKLIDKSQNNQIYNLKGKKIYKNIGVSKTIIDIFNKKGISLPKPSIKFIDNRLGHDFKYLVSDKKARKLIGNYQEVDFKTGLNLIIDSLKNLK